MCDKTGDLRITGFILVKVHRFNEAKENSYIGIPALITDYGKITIDWESYFTEQGIEVVHPGEAGAACTVDGKGC